MELVETLFGYVMCFGPYVISAVIIGLLAARKNRNGWAWGLIGGLFLLPGLIVLMFLPYLCPKCRQSISKTRWKLRTCPRCGRIRYEGWR